MPLPRRVIALPRSDLCTYCAQEEQSYCANERRYRVSNSLTKIRNIFLESQVFSRILFLSPPPIFYIYSFFPDNKSRIDKIIRFLEDKIERFEESIKNWFLNDEKVRILLERRKLFVQRVCKICVCMYKARLIVYNVF